MDSDESLGGRGLSAVTARRQATACSEVFQCFQRRGRSYFRPKTKNDKKSANVVKYLREKKTGFKANPFEARMTGGQGLSI